MLNSIDELNDDRKVKYTNMNVDENLPNSQYITNYNRCLTSMYIKDASINYTLELTLDNSKITYGKMKQFLTQNNVGIRSIINTYNWWSGNPKTTYEGVSENLENYKIELKRKDSSNMRHIDRISLEIYSSILKEQKPESRVVNIFKAINEYVKLYEAELENNSENKK